MPGDRAKALRRPHERYDPLVVLLQRCFDGAKLEEGIGHIVKRCEPDLVAQGFVDAPCEAAS